MTMSDDWKARAAAAEAENERLRTENDTMSTELALLRSVAASILNNASELPSYVRPRITGVLLVRADDLNVLATSALDGEKSA
jgi:cell division protein FtsB